eukprot:3097664-Pyramimonas_sp.AAC.1
MLALGAVRGREVLGTAVDGRGARGLVLRDRMDASQSFEFLGAMLDGRARWLRHAARRSWRRWLALGRALRLRRCSGDGPR